MPELVIKTTAKEILLMKKPVLVLLLSMLCITNQEAQTNTEKVNLKNDLQIVKSAVLADFDWMTIKVRKNYSGYRDKIIDTTKLNHFTDSIRTIVRNSNSFENAIPEFKSWLKWFKDSHLSIGMKKRSLSSEIKFDSTLTKFNCNSLNRNTTLLVLPSFNIKYKRVIDSLLETNDNLIRSSKNLIVDIRNNGGGSDESFGKLIPFIYTNPIIRVNSDVWSTEDNIKKYESIFSDTHYSNETRQAMKVFVQKLKKNIGQFVSQGVDDTLHLSISESFPEKIIIVINSKVASSAEGFLLKAIQSKKVIVAGEHSKGELDYANVYYMDSPSNMLVLGCPTRRTRRLPKFPIDNVGVQPDVFINTNKNWIDYIVNRIDDFEFSLRRFSKITPNAIKSRFAWEENKDTSLVDFRLIANSIINPNYNSTVDIVKQVVDWTNKNFEWTFTDYKSRTLKQIIVRGGGNCNEQTRITRELLSQLGIKTRSVREINIQPDNEMRQTRAEEKVKELGNRLSVFGLGHNDHVWVEFFDDADGNWKPADATLGLVGVESWLNARIGFSPRPTHSIIPSRDMIVPICIFAIDNKNGGSFENRSDYYLIDQFNLAYSGKLEKLSEWKSWVQLIKSVGPKCQEAFEGKSNLHEQTQLIQQIKNIYESLKNNFEKQF